ncbi:MAG TPA: phytoene/squalene synthase family protein [Acidimicrobiales bacterium]|nr:phytoene/squalene synthase family protein [Acidimicrobiales bacterium]
MTDLASSYRLCRSLNRRSGTTYFWATHLLAPGTRPHVHALYGFCRHADDIVDDLGPAPVDARAGALAAFGERFFADLDAGASDDPVLAAVVHTAVTYGIHASCFRRFLRSMTMDLTVAAYPTFDALLDYMDGSAAVIGEMMLPLLGATGPAATAAARDLGIAFQLTNFWRDVAEDLDRGRVYVPQDDLDRFGARDALDGRRVTDAWRALLRFELERTRAYYRSADAGVALLPPASAHAIAGARTLYAGILDRIEAAGYDVFASRARVPTWRKVAVGLRALRPRRPGEPAGYPADAASAGRAAARALTARGTIGQSIP